MRFLSAGGIEELPVEVSEEGISGPLKSPPKDQLALPKLQQPV